MTSFDASVGAMCGGAGVTGGIATEDLNQALLERGIATSVDQRALLDCVRRVQE